MYDLQVVSQNGNPNRSQSVETFCLRISTLLDEISNHIQMTTHSFYRTTALINAARDGHLDVVQYLVEQGADIEAQDMNRSATVIYSALSGHLDVVKCLVEHGADTEVKDWSGSSAPIKATSLRHLPVVKCLVQQGTDIELQNDIGCTALIMAASLGDLDTVPNKEPTPTSRTKAATLRSYEPLQTVILM